MRSNILGLISLVTILSLVSINSVFADIPLTDARIITNLPSSSIYTCFFIPDPNTLNYVAPPFGICAVFPTNEYGTITIYDSGVGGNTTYIDVELNPYFVHINEIRLQYLSAYNELGSYYLAKSPFSYVSTNKLAFFSTGNSKLSTTASSTGYFGIYVPSSRSITLKYIAIDKAIPVYPFVAVGKEYTKEEILNEPPSITIESPADNERVGDTFYLHFIATDPEGKSMTCYYSIDNGQWTEIGAVTSGSPVQVLINNIYIGKHLITVRCYDPFNAIGEASIHVINEKPPTVLIVDPKNNDLVTSEYLTLYYYVGDDRAASLSCEIKLDGSTIDTFTEVVNAQLVTGQRSLDLSGTSSGTHTLQLNCTDESGLSNYHQISFELCRDPDECQSYCEDIGGEWYVNHCCGDDSGEHLSTESEPGQAFIPSNCSIVDLEPGQCDDTTDCGIEGWYCSNSTAREYRIYSCAKGPGEIIGTCQYTISQTEDCLSYGADFFCSYGRCVNETPPQIPPVITIVDPSDGSTVEVPITQKYLDVQYKVTDDTSSYVLCVLKYNGKSVNLGQVPANGSLQVTQILLDTNITSYTITIECTDKDNLTANVSSSFTVQFTYQNVCEVDDDCGVDGWVCVSTTERKYLDYKCVEGSCTVEVTQVETCPSGTYCYHGQCVDYISCQSDSDCPADEWVCADSSTREHRDWYCDVDNGYCRYNVDKTESCTNNTTCLSGVCQEPGTCPGPTYVCIDNHTKAEIVWYYDSDLKKCVGIQLSPETCPEGTLCVDGKCGGNPNMAPTIEIISPHHGEEVEVGKPVTIKFKVSDDNSLAINVKIYVSHSPAEKIFDELVTSSQETEVTFTPQESGTYTITFEAYDGYGSQSTSQITIEAVSAPTPGGGGGGAGGGAGGAPAAPSAPAAPAGGVGVTTPAMMIGKETSLLIGIVVVVIIVVGVVYYYYRSRY